MAGPPTAFPPQAPSPSVGETAVPVLATGWAGPPIRAEDIEFVPLDDVDLTGAMAIIGVSSLGSAGSLVARYLIERLQMDLVGAFYSDRLFPAGASHHGVMTSTLQVWRAEVACGPEGECKQLLVIKNDLPVDLPVMAPLSGAITKWAAKAKFLWLVGIESYRSSEVGDAPVFVAASGPARGGLGKLRATPLDDAIVVGFEAALLASANHEQVCAVVLFGPHRPPDGDSKAAAAALRAALPILPETNIPQEDMEHELARVEEQLKRQVKAAMEGKPLERGLRGYA